MNSVNVLLCLIIHLERKVALQHGCASILAAPPAIITSSLPHPTISIPQGENPCQFRANLICKRSTLVDSQRHHTP
jgi:hypothetical protein